MNKCTNYVSITRIRRECTAEERKGFDVTLRFAADLPNFDYSDSWRFASTCSARTFSSMIAAMRSE